MLKPKKGFNKKDLQRDPLLEFINDFGLKLKKNRNKYLQIAGGIAVAVILVIVISGRVSDANESADSQLGLALAALETGDVTNAQFQFENLINSSSGSSKANAARYYLATLRYAQGDFEGASSLLTEFLSKGSDDHIKAKGYLLQANIQKEKGELDNALKTLNSGISKVSNSYYKNSLSILKAECLFENGDISGASDICTAILDDKTIDSSLRVKAEMLSGKLNG